MTCRRAHRAAWPAGPLSGLVGPRATGPGPRACPGRFSRPRPRARGRRRPGPHELVRAVRRRRARPRADRPGARVRPPGLLVHDGAPSPVRMRERRPAQTGRRDSAPSEVPVPLGRPVRRRRSMPRAGRPSTTGSTVVPPSADSPHWPGSVAFVISRLRASWAAMSRSGGTADRLSCVGSAPARAASRSVTRRTTSPQRMWWPAAVGVMARRNGPRARGMVISAVMPTASADRPKTVTWSGSPPKPPIWSPDPFRRGDPVQETEAGRVVGSSRRGPNGDAAYGTPSKAVTSPSRPPRTRPAAAGTATCMVPHHAVDLPQPRSPAGEFTGTDSWTVARLPCCPLEPARSSARTPCLAEVRP